MKVSDTYGYKLCFVSNNEANNTYSQLTLDQINEHNNALIYAPYVLLSVLEEGGISVWIKPSDTLERVKEWAYQNDDEYVYHLLHSIT